MATKVLCDGCSIELKPGDACRAKIATQRADEYSGVTDDYDLCCSCLKTVRLYFNPKIWGRAAPAI